MAKRSRPAPPTPTAPPSRAPDPRLGILVLVALALALRVWGIDWALPNATRAFSYHPDESVVVSYALRLDPFAGRLDSGFYNYGSLALLLNAVILRLGAAAGVVALDEASGIPSASALLAARLVTVLLGTGTCLFLYGAGNRLYGRRAGLLAAALWAVAPLAVQHGHFATVDVPSVFFLTGALCFAARHLSSAAARPRDLLWTGVWAGLAAATKYNAGLVLLAGAAAWWLRGERAGKGLGLLVGGAALGFALGCPGVLLNPSALIAGIAYEAQHVRAGHGSVFVGTPPALLYHVAFNLRWGLGVPLLLLALTAAGGALRRRRPADLVLLAFAVPYYLLIGLAEVKFARYTLPLFPPLFLLAGGLLTAFASARARRISAYAAAVAAAYALLFSLALDATMARPDPRDQAAAFVRGSGAASVGFAAGPWFYSPPLNPFLSAFNPEAARRAAAANTAPRLIPADGEWNVSQLAATRPDIVALSEINGYADALRLRDPAARAYIAALRRDYPNPRVFGNPVQVFGIPFTKLAPGDSLPVQGLPHDMLYTNPTTVLWTR